VNHQKHQHPQRATELENLSRNQEALTTEEAETTRGGMAQLCRGGTATCIGVAYDSGDFYADATDLYYDMMMIP
jgi:hypothetical protein